MIYPSASLDPRVKALVDILEGAPVRFSWLFGSAARGEGFRDLDVAAEFLEGHDSLPRLLELGLELEKAAGAPVDLVPLAGAPLALQYEVSKGRLLTCQDPEFLADWKERVWRLYFDRQYFLQSYAREMFQVRAERSTT